MSLYKKTTPRSSERAAPGAHVALADPLAELARAAAAGDAEAAHTLVLQAGGRMVAVIRKVLGRDHPDVDDVAQDAVIGLINALAEFRGESTVLHYASRIALLSALGARRRRAVRDGNTEQPEEPIDELPDTELPSPLASALAKRRRRLVRQLLGELPEVIAESLALHFVLGHTVEEIATLLDVSPNTVWSRLRLGKQALKRKLGAERQLLEQLEETP